MSILIMNILLCPKNQKNVLQKKVKDWSFEAYLLTDETVLGSSDWIIDDLCQILYVVLNFLDCFSWHVLPKISKMTDLSKVTRKERIGANLTCPKLAKMVNFELLKVSKMINLKIYISSVKGATVIKFGQ